jgi:DnaJ-domain-containing protein 1
MKEKLKKLEIKKIFKEYNLLLADDEYKKEMVNEYRSEFLSKIENKKKELGIKPEEVKIENIESSGQTTETVKTLIDVDENTKKKLKKIYKEIVKKTHPDKIDSEKYLEMYITSKKAFEENNIIDLYSICIDLEIDFEYTDTDIQSMLSIIDSKKSKLKNLESSYL